MIQSTPTGSGGKLPTAASATGERADESPRRNKPRFGSRPVPVMTLAAVKSWKLT
jgi:hypothetical protein